MSEEKEILYLIRYIESCKRWNKDFDGLTIKNGGKNMAFQFTDTNFQKEALESDIPVLVDFYADWCGPCKMMAPVVSELAEEYQGVIKIGKLNVDQEAETAEKYRVMSIPTMMIFKNGNAMIFFIEVISPSKKSPSPPPWTCISINPGDTKLPFASMTLPSYKPVSFTMFFIFPSSIIILKPVNILSVRIIFPFFIVIILSTPY
jgi:thioredoxin 1